ncbi:glutamate--ammonia ligase [Fusarium piperis]|uniref:glutamine synthetase n=1 Tax=Fusarium piperis TaxID=1435070 RepID=A0A9W8TAZ4_9HYPO|nr:glutamate--ammonia ligase [Fusarium piperis]
MTLALRASRAHEGILRVDEPQRDAPLRRAARRLFRKGDIHVEDASSAWLATRRPNVSTVFISNFSTKAMREEGGMKVIEEALKKLEPHHAECIAEYGEDNELRLTGRHETGSIDSFSWGVANRGTSIRVPRETAAKGYVTSRTTASNVDPYRVTRALLQFSLA